jgi:hypothetical protein
MMTRSQKAMRPQPRTVWSAPVGRVCQNPSVVDNVSGYTRRVPSPHQFSPRNHTQRYTFRATTCTKFSFGSADISTACPVAPCSRKGIQTKLLATERKQAEHQRHKGLRVAIATDLANSFFSRPTPQVCVRWNSTYDLSVKKQCVSGTFLDQRVACQSGF